MDIPKRPDIAANYLQRKILERKSFALSVVSWIVVILLVWQFLIPQIQLSLTAYTSMDSARKNLISLQDKLTFIQSFQSDAFATQRERVDSILPSYKPFLPLMNTLQQLSVEQNVALTGIELNPGNIATDAATVIATARAENGLATLPVKLTVFGDLGNVNAYLDSLNRAIPILEISEISLNPRSNKTAESSENVEVGTAYEGQISVISYYAPITAQSVLAQKLPVLSNVELTFLKTLDQFMVLNLDMTPRMDLNKTNLFTY